MNRHWIARIAASAAIRKVVYILTALAVYALLSLIGIGKAHAEEFCGLKPQSQAVLEAGINNTYPSKVLAQAACNALPTTVVTVGGGGGWYARGNRQACVWNEATSNFTVTYTDTTSFNVGDCSGAYSTPPQNRPSTGWKHQADECPAGQQVNPETGECWTPPDEEDCLARNVDAKKKTTIIFSGTACIDGCSYGPTKPGTITQPGGIRSGEMGYTGQVCNVPPPNPKPDPEDDPEQKCVPVGTLTMCIKPNGDHCYSATTGRQICWAPGETGEKTDGPVKQVVSPGETPNAPSPPKPGDTQAPAGNTGPITTTNNNGNTNTTNVSNFGTGSGSNAGNRNSGEPGDGSGGEDNNPDDDEDEGSADGGGTCETAPTCSGDAIQCALLQQQWMTRCEGKPGDAGTGLGTLYEGSDRTAGDAFGDFRARIGDAPLIDAGGQFFSVNASGSCPVFSVPATEFWEPLTFDYHCSGDLNSFLLLGGYLVLAVAAFAAFKIAVY